MLFFVDPHSGVPIFRQLMDQVRTHVAGGVLKPGDEMPSIRSLSVPLGVNPMTISKAYNMLVTEGVLDRRPGLPLVVADHGPGDLEDRRRDQLRTSLLPAAQMAASMGVGSREALKIFRELLETIEPPGEES